MNELEVALNEELSSVLGANHNWTGLISAVVKRRASSFAAYGNGLLDDVLTDVTGDIIIQARDGKLAEAVIRAKEASETDEELVGNLQGVVSKAAYFRTSDAMRYRYKSSQQFSQMENDGGDFSDQIADRSQAEIEFGTPDYVKLLIDELELMAVAEEWGQKAQFKHRVKRLRLAKEVVVDRAAGMNIRSLCKKHNLTLGSTMSSILRDIEKALYSVARKSDDPTLIRGTRGVTV